MTKRLLLPVLLAAASLAFAAPALAATPAAISENWAGYEASSQNGAGFSAVSGSWRQPTVSCTPGQATYSAYWVGLGGGGQGSSALEQVGTQADCNASGQTSHYAWYELVPSAPVRLNLTIKPGDLIYARTAVDGEKVTVSLQDKTTGQSATKTLTMRDPDTSTAEWIAEAPSQCIGSATGNCEVLPLTDFGRVNFTSALARSASKVSSAGGFGAQTVALETSTGTATASALSSNGSAFHVTYGAQSPGGYVDPTAYENDGDGWAHPDGYGYPGGYGYYPGGYGYYSGYGAYPF